MSWYLAGSLTWCSLAPLNSASAQIIPDGTLGAESSTVTPDTIKGLPSARIDGGATRGTNLFHSFGEFNVGVGNGAYFSNPSGIENIITRVTGSNLSQIQGKLGVLGNANLFFLNPNGIVFGPNASLDVRGSFLASTANSVLFNNGFAFSATDPQAPPLLTVNVPIGLQYRGNPGAIQSQGAILQVPTGQTLTLAGGTVNINGGALQAPGGRVELAGVAAPGEVGLTQQGQEWQLRVPEGLARADLAINNAIVGVLAGGGGSIALTAQNLKLTGARTSLLGGIAPGLGTVGAQAGDIDINTAEATNIDASSVFNQLVGTGNAGAINITTGSLFLTNGARVDASTFGKGNSGNINIIARDAVSFDGVGVGSDGTSSLANSVVGPGAVGQGGDVNITTGSLFLTNGAQLATSTLGEGNSGNINITARDRVSFDGGSNNRLTSSVLSLVGPSGVGKGGDINIGTGSLSVTNGAQLGAPTAGKGNSGNINITARDAVSFDGVGSNGSSSNAFTANGSEVGGQGGDINITTGALSVTNGARLDASTIGKGDSGNINITARDRVSFDGAGSSGLGGAFTLVGASGVGKGGDINITTGSLSVTNGARLGASTSGEGNAGSINIIARDAVSFDGVSSNGLDSAFTLVGSSGVGKGGDISISTGSLSVTNGARLGASTSGKGNAGNISIIARGAVSFDGVSSNGFDSSAFSTVESSGVGQGGDINITAETLEVLNGRISASTVGLGNSGNINLSTDTLTLSGGRVFAATGTQSGRAGNLTVKAAKSVQISGAGRLSVEAIGGGMAGNLTLETGQMIVSDGGQVTVSSPQGQAGNLTIKANSLSLNRGSILAETGKSGVESGANITLQFRDLLRLENESLISATANGGANGGNINIDPTFVLIFPPTGPNGSDIIAKAERGNGGKINISTQGLFGIKQRLSTPGNQTNDIDASSEFGSSGQVQLTSTVDPTQGVAQIPETVVDPNALVAQSPCKRGSQSQFTRTGRGGLPPNLSDDFSGETTQVGLVKPAPSIVAEGQPQKTSSGVAPNENQTAKIENPMVPAQGWSFNDEGDVVLTAYNPAVTGPQRLKANPVGCPAF